MSSDRTFGGCLQFRAALFVLGSLSVGSLLLYFLGLGSFGLLGGTLLTVETAGLIGAGLWSRGEGRERERELLLAGLWAGCLATIVYDAVRVPIVHGGVPVFKAISYFGTVLVGGDHPSVVSELLGWAYHLSNGVSFGLMYAAIARKPGPVTAAIWGLALEGTMLLTPYAEVFGYQRDARFLAITIGSHIAYGLTLWAALRYFAGTRGRQRGVPLVAGFVAVPLCLGAMAADFNLKYADKIPHSPPPTLGANLYTVWNVPEPDRICAMWIWSRMVQPKAEFYFIEPFEKVRFGQGFDVPEAQVRRSGTESATERLVQQRRPSDSKLAALARMTHMAEVTPWMISSDAESAELAEMLRAAMAQKCGKKMNNACLPQLFGTLDEWYRK